MDKRRRDRLPLKAVAIHEQIAKPDEAWYVQSVRAFASKIHIKSKNTNNFCAVMTEGADRTYLIPQKCKCSN